MCAKAKVAPCRSGPGADRTLLRVYESSAVEVDFCFVDSLTCLSLYCRELGAGGVTVVPTMDLPSALSV